MAQDTGKFRTNTKDQYYTKQAIATQCVKTIFEKVPEVVSYQWIEPSAGERCLSKLCFFQHRQAGYWHWSQVTRDPQGRFLTMAAYFRQTASILWKPTLWKSEWTSKKIHSSCSNIWHSHCLYSSSVVCKAQYVSCVSSFVSLCPHRRTSQV